MKKMSFTSRDLGRATEIYNQMLSDPDCSIVLVVAGSTSAGGCMDLYADLVKHNLVDAIVATGAPIVDMDRSEERSVGKECVSTCSSRWSPDPYKKKTKSKKNTRIITITIK